MKHVSFELRRSRKLTVAERNKLVALVHRHHDGWESISPFDLWIGREAGVLAHFEVAVPQLEHAEVGWLLEVLTELRGLVRGAVCSVETDDDYEWIGWDEKDGLYRIDGGAPDPPSEATRPQADRYELASRIEAPKARRGRKPPARETIQIPGMDADLVARIAALAKQAAEGDSSGRWEACRALDALDPLEVIQVGLRVRVNLKRGRDLEWALRNAYERARLDELDPAKREAAAAAVAEMWKTTAVRGGDWWLDATRYAEPLIREPTVQGALLDVLLATWENRDEDRLTSTVIALGKAPGPAAAGALLQRLRADRGVAPTSEHDLRIDEGLGDASAEETEAEIAAKRAPWRPHILRVLTEARLRCTWPSLLLELAEEGRTLFYQALDSLLELFPIIPRLPWVQRIYEHGDRFTRQKLAKRMHVTGWPKAPRMSHGLPLHPDERARLERLELETIASLRAGKAIAEDQIDRQLDELAALARDHVQIVTAEQREQLLDEELRATLARWTDVGSPSLVTELVKEYEPARIVRVGLQQLAAGSPEGKLAGLTRTALLDAGDAAPFAAALAALWRAWPAGFHANLAGVLAVAVDEPDVRAVLIADVDGDDSASVARRDGAARALASARRATDEVAAALVRRWRKLRDGPSVPKEFFAALGRLASPRLVATALLELARPERGTTRDALRMLAAGGARGVAQLARLARVSARRSEVVAALGESKAEEATDVLIELAEDPDPRMREQCCAALLQPGHRDRPRGLVARAAIWRSLDDLGHAGDGGPRMMTAGDLRARGPWDAAVRALGHEPLALPPLSSWLELLTSPHPESRRHALQKVDERGDPQTLRAFALACELDFVLSPRGRPEARNAPLPFGSGGWPSDWPQPTIDDGPSWVRWALARAETIPGQRSTPALDRLAALGAPAFAALFPPSAGLVLDAAERASLEAEEAALAQS
jgi:hypothetical protein